MRAPSPPPRGIIGGPNYAPPSQVASAPSANAYGLEVLSLVTAGAKVTSAAKQPAGKFLVSVQPSLAGVTGNGAGTYLRVKELWNGGGGSPEVVRVIWAGYVRPNVLVASIPNTRTKVGMTYVAEAWSIQEHVGKTLTVSLYFDDEPSGGTTIHNEAPGSGPGVPRLKQLTDPAAGLDYADVMVPAGEEWAVFTFTAKLAATGVANRYFQLALANSAGGAQIGGVQEVVAITNGDTIYHTWGVNQGSNHRSGAPGADNAAIPNVRLDFGVTLKFQTAGIQVLDQWSAGYLFLYVWANPA